MKNQPRTERSSKQLTAIQTSRHFRVSQRKHTGHVMARQHTSYPVLVMIVLCVGVLLLSLSHIANADTFTYPDAKQDTLDVHARVPGPPPAVAATIDQPLDGDVFTDVPITVTGTCPADTYVALLRNGTFSGTAICEADGTYSIKTGLYSGINQLMAQVNSRTDQPGPASNIVKITYNPPKPLVTAPTEDEQTPINSKNDDTSPKQPSATGRKQAAAITNGSSTSVAPGTSSRLIEPLLFKNDYSYQGVYTGQPTLWNLALSGGVAPYAVNVDWGDSTNTILSRPKAGAFTLQHQYKQAGKYKGSYTAMFVASDALGAKTYMQLVTVVNDPPKLGVAGTTSSSSGGPLARALTQLFQMDASPSYLGHLVKYVWPGYGMVVLMLLSFWLGERRELQYVRAHPLKRARHRR